MKHIIAHITGDKLEYWQDDEARTQMDVLAVLEKCGM